MADEKDPLALVRKDIDALTVRVGKLEKRGAAIDVRLDGGLEETEHYCTECGARFEAGERCANHPGAKVSHAGIDPRNGKSVVIRTA